MTNECSSRCLCQCVFEWAHQIRMPVSLSVCQHLRKSLRLVGIWPNGHQDPPHTLPPWRCWDLAVRPQIFLYRLPRFDRICPNLCLLFELHEIWSVDSQENCGGAAGRLNSGRLEHTRKSSPLGLGPTLRPLGSHGGGPCSLHRSTICNNFLHGGRYTSAKTNDCNESTKKRQFNMELWVAYEQDYKGK